MSYEVCPETITITLRDAENRITKKTRAIMLVTLEILTKFTNSRKNINCVIEDATHAFGCACKGKK